MSRFWETKNYGGFFYNRVLRRNLTVRDKLCSNWYPTPGCNMHKDIIGDRRGEILFKKYCFGNKTNYKLHHKANIMYWRSHPTEWTKIQEMVKREHPRT